MNRGSAQGSAWGAARNQAKLAAGNGQRSKVTRVTSGRDVGLGERTYTNLGIERLRRAG